MSYTKSRTLEEDVVTGKIRAIGRSQELMEVGDFGVGSTAMPRSVFNDLFAGDINTPVLINGDFSLAVASDDPNNPVPGLTINGVLSQTVYDSSAGLERIHQMFYRTNTVDRPDVFQRYYLYSQGWSPWSKLYGTRNILGIVSQSGGVPTGAIIERGSNSNGEYVKFADGTLICSKIVTHTGINIAFGSIYESDDITWIYPTGFAFAPTISGLGRSGNNRLWLVSGNSGTSATNTSFKICRPGTTDSTVQVTIQAIGRWY